jgi:hypothetical protein
MPFKSIATDFSPGKTKIFDFKIAMFNKKAWATLPAEQKKQALEYLEDCQNRIDHYKQWVGLEIEKDRFNGIRQGLLTTPMMGKTLEYIGFTNDSMGEIFESEAMYYGIKDSDGRILILKSE